MVTERVFFFSSYSHSTSFANRLCFFFMKKPTNAPSQLFIGSGDDDVTLGRSANGYGNGQLITLPLKRVQYAGIGKSSGSVGAGG
jgi:hypothetical protein